jgi:hypothetical protein
MKAPPISKDLIEYLEKVYSPAHFQVAATASPHEIAALVHRENGVQHVVGHLRAIHEEQQNEDPLNVYEDT